jgi:hypothetical protein
MKNYAEAILALAPNAQFRYENDDLDSLLWLDESITQPDVKDIEAKAKALIVEADKAIEAKVTARASALAKLAALGLTPDEVASL